MEYLQMTLDDWVTMKERLKQDLNGVAESFVRIGYTLRAIKEQKLYEQDGYENMETFALCEYGLSPSTVSRFIAINKKYSLNGNSGQLRPEFTGMGSTKLAEMLTLPDTDYELIRPETTRESIRELKEFNRTVPEEEKITDLQNVIIQFYMDNPTTLNAIYGADIQNTADLEELVYLVNPSGNRTYRKGLFFLILYNQSEGIKFKKHGQDPEAMSWARFLEITKDIFDQSDRGKKTYETYFGISAVQEDPLAKEKPKAEKEKVAPAQNSGRKPDLTTKQEQETSDDKQGMKTEDCPETFPEGKTWPRIGMENAEDPNQAIIGFPVDKEMKERITSILGELLDLVPYITHNEADTLQAILTAAEDKKDAEWKGVCP